ncbi:hypothetical protein AZH47_00845 [Corynebacterium striatum]|nr:hypothetical protein AZH47_00845 [Corynebacterium striatum]
MEVTIINKINILDITFKLFITTPHFSNIHIVIFSNSFINVDLQNCLQLIIFSYKHIFYFLSLNFLSTKENGVITNAKMMKKLDLHTYQIQLVILNPIGISKQKMKPKIYKGQKYLQNTTPF